MIIFRIFLLLLFFLGLARAQDIREVISPGGIRAWLIYDESAPAVSMSFYFRGLGSASGQAGAMNLLSSMMLEGAGSLDSEAFAKRLNDLSIEMDYAVGRDSFYGSVRSLRSYWSEASALLRLSLIEARLAEDDFVRMKRVLRSRLRQDSQDAGVSAGNLLWSYVFGDDVYGLPVRGRESDLDKISLADMRAHYERFSKEGLYIGVAGAITAEALAPALDEIFGDLPATSPLPLSAISARASPANGGKTVLRRMSVPQTHIAFLHRGISRDDADFFAAYVANHIVGGSLFSSRLGLEVREKRGLAYSVHSNLHILARVPLILGWAATDNGRAAETVSLIRSVWQRAGRGEFTQEQLDRARQYLLGSFVIRLTSTRNIADLLAYWQREGYGRDYIAYRSERLQAITLSDLNRVARRLFRADSLSFALVGDPTGILADHIVE